MDIKSFPPISTRKARVLILGSMPGVKSLQEQQYYAHKQNSFWRIMSRLFEAPIETYAQRVDLIKSNNLALWDVLQACYREGSLDTGIKDESIVVNDFAGFFAKHPHITHVFFNGGKAEKEFMKRVAPHLKRKLVYMRLPSTSPAHAGSSFEKKLKAWRRLKP